MDTKELENKIAITELELAELREQLRTQTADYQAYIGKCYKIQSTQTQCSYGVVLDVVGSIAKCKFLIVNNTRFSVRTEECFINELGYAEEITKEQLQEAANKAAYKFLTNFFI